MSHFKEALLLMKERFLTILALGAIIITPIYLFNQVFVNYLYRYYGSMDLFFIADFFHVILILTGLSVAQIPFIELAYRDVMGEDIRFKDGIRSFMEHVFPVYVMGLIYAVLSAVGGLLLILPGILIAIWFFLFPYVAVIEHQHWWKGYKWAFVTGKKYFFKLLLVILLYGLFEMIVGTVANVVTLFLTERLLVVTLIQLVLSYVFVPLFTFLITYFYIDWNGGPETYREGSYAEQQEFGYY